MILNHWKRATLDQQLAALHEQTVRPTHIWLCLFNSPKEAEYLNIVKKWQPKFGTGVLQPITSPVNFKYYGRFQLALQAHTKYVWVFDDDVIPGKRFLELLRHTIETKDFRGVLGAIGWIMPQVSADGLVADYR